jgi:DNA-binding SARP family transcriptional activator
VQTALEPALGRPRPRRAAAARRPAPKTLAADAFDLFPNAVMICDRRGRVVAANARFRADVSAVADGATCCRLLGCLRTGTALEHICVTAEALARREQVTGLRVETAAGRLHVSAAPLYEDLSHVVVELRRERAEAAEREPLRVFTLGTLRVETADENLAGDWVDQRPGELLRYLVAVHPRVASSDAIAEAIWPQAGPAAANSVRHFVHVLRERLEPGRPKGARSSYVVCRHGGYALASVAIDADEFEAEATRGIAALEGDDVRAAERHLARAAQLYDGDFLADDPYAEWALAERERLRAKACDVLRALAEIRAGSADGAACLERLAEMEPFDSDVQRRLIATWLSLGRRSRAVRHYQAFKWRLVREFGEAPGFDLAELAVRGA